jgi:hypothetical protein
MKRGTRFLLIVGGYGVAFLLAAAAARVFGMSRAADPSDGMVAFSESLVFLGVFALASVPSTGFVLFQLRRHRRFWVVGAVLAVLVSLTALWALVHTLHPAAARGTWADLSPIRILVAPVFALGALLAGLICPFRSSRLAFLGVFLVEAVVFAGVFLFWMQSAAG